MAAEVYRTPPECEEPSFDSFFKPGGGMDTEAYFKAVQTHREKLAEWCRQNTFNQRPHALIGETISWPVADGRAEYMVLSTTPLQLIHLDYVDGYQVDDVMLRGLRVSDVKEMVRQRKAIEDLFGNKTKRAAS